VALVFVLHRIEVGVRHHLAVLAVIDTGIDPDQAAHDFERFSRGTAPGSGDTSPRTAGAG
jgi:hypothetical protein